MDATTLLDTMLTKVTKLIDQLEVRPEKMKQHIDESYDTHWTQVILHQAILIGLDRDDVYRLLQATAFEAIQKKISMLTLLKSQPMFERIDITKLIQSTTSIKVLYQRVFK
jgi:adenylosuccinate lyase